MKRLFKLFTFFALVTLLSVLFMAQTVSAAERVIYVSDSGTGDGSSPSSPLGPTTVVPLNEWVEGDNTYTVSGSWGSYTYTPEEANQFWFCKKSIDAYYKNSVLYQAAELLLDTGGRIVIVDEVRIGYAQSLSSTSHVDRDFYMPDYGKNAITISGYDSSSRLILCEGAHFQAGGDTIFENIHIGSMMTELNARGLTLAHYSADGGAKNRTICGRGHKLVIGENVVTTNFDGQTSAAYYPSIAGAGRFENTDYDTDVTVNSGTWYQVLGITRGIAANAAYAATGNVKVTLNDGIFLDTICLAGKDNTYTIVKDVELNINGGDFRKSIYASGNRGCMYPDNVAKVTIKGGKFSSGASVYSYWARSTIPFDFMPQVILDMSSANLTASEVNSLTRNLYAQSILYPVKFCTSAQMLTPASNDYAFVGGEFNAEGLSVRATFNIGGTNYQSDVEFYMGAPGFGFDFDNTSEGNRSITYKYGTVSYHTGNVNVLNIPSVSILGAQVRTDSSAEQALRFVARIDKRYGDQISVSDYGFIALPSSSLFADELRFDTVYGANEITSFGEVFRPELGAMYNGNTYLTYSGIYPGLTLKDFNSGVAAVAYVRFSHGGDEYTVYSEKSVKSILGVANAAYASSEETAAVKSWIKTNVIDAYASYDANRNVSYNAASSTSLRQKVVDYLFEEMSYEWSPGTTFELGGITYTAGTTYRGIPYVANSLKKATLEEFKRDTTDVKTSAGATKHIYIGPIDDIDDEKYIRYNVPKKKLTEEERVLESFAASTDHAIFFNAWNKVSTNDVWFTSLMNVLPGCSASRGALPVGPYAYTGTDTGVIVKTNNSAQTMYESYAMTKKGDVLIVYKSDSRSLWMVTGNVSVVRKGDGTIDPDASTMQISYIAGTLSSGSPYRLNVSRTFTQAYDADRIPVTIPELATGLYTPTTTTLQGFDGETSIVDQYVVGTVRSNRSITSVNVKILRLSEALYDRTFFYGSPSDLNVNKVDLSDFDISAPVGNFVEGKTYELIITANVASEGDIELVRYSYTKPLIDPGKYESFVTQDIQGVNQRDETVNNMLEQAAYEWKPTVSFEMYGTNSETWQPSAHYVAGRTYRGVAYTNTRSTSAEFDEHLGTGSGIKNFDPLEFVDTSNLVTVNSFTNADKHAYTGRDADGLYNTIYVESGDYYVIDWNRIMGNHCSAADVNAIQQTIRMNASSFRNNPAQIYLKLPADSGYDYCATYLKEYGLNALCEMYALGKKGDVLYKNGPGGGHTRLLYADAVVVRKSDGLVDPDASYVRCIEQTDTLESKVNSSFISTHGYDTTWWIDHKYTFRQMFNTNCMIITLADYVTGESENPFIGVTKKASADTILDRVFGSVESNFPILMVRMRILDSSDNLVDIAEFRQHPINTNSNYVRYLKYDLSGLYKKLDLASLPSGTYTYKLDVEIGRGIFEMDSVTFTK